ncbi:hypothetical protein [Actinomadura rudentiformis]|uniref:Uncharacterized protein n=1 Tax=Actinomadura rudentiformis TaxID=359158 RepID=A0A6H9ZAK4_9ACTN|nr:hypothetical protein [Actinomadura rudentiformis]KAB2351372.1 hypothetical protein F8566_03700 [Actinomadura rudentiformis]
MHEEVGLGGVIPDLSGFALGDLDRIVLVQELCEITESLGEEGIARFNAAPPPNQNASTTLRQ